MLRRSCSVFAAVVLATAVAVAIAACAPAPRTEEDAAAVSDAPASGAGGSAAVAEAADVLPAARRDLLLIGQVQLYDWEDRKLEAGDGTIEMTPISSDCCVKRRHPCKHDIDSMGDAESPLELALRGGTFELALPIAAEPASLDWRVEKLIVDGDPVVPTRSIWSVTADHRLEITACRPPLRTLRAVDRDSGRALEQLYVERDDWGDPSTFALRRAPVELRSRTADELKGRTWVHVAAPGYSWSHALIELGRPGSDEIRLVAGADLVIEVRGRIPETPCVIHVEDENGVRVATASPTGSETTLLTWPEGRFRVRFFARIEDPTPILGRHSIVVDETSATEGLPFLYSYVEVASGEAILRTRHRERLVLRLDLEEYERRVAERRDPWGPSRMNFREDVESNR